MPQSSEVQAAVARAIDAAEIHGAYSEEAAAALEALDLLNREAYDATRDEIAFRLECEHSLRR